ncbi:hypothetical protein, partial [Nocardioides sp. URHA0020]|uniref:hypothetical protein n=1 Tax=Nocardioides sp. URHA0020 TaxID=1380392 RepID=UPI001E37AB0E
TRVIGEKYEVVNPLHRRTWTDESGVLWRRRGQENLTPRQARRLFARSDALVMHVQHGAPHQHTGPNLPGLLVEVEEVWAGDDDNGMHVFDIGEFRDDSRRVLVMIVEGC